MLEEEGSSVGRHCVQTNRAELSRIIAERGGRAYRSFWGKRKLKADAKQRVLLVDGLVNFEEVR